ncbi:MAG: filamentous hemagglutinin N-terminal domain-containing protein, partial [Cyanobacteria bacterium P01_D01_bin.123]
MTIRLHAVCCACFLFVSAINTQHAAAQVLPDGTTPTEINTVGSESTISRGSIRGPNQFHSFESFSVQSGERITFVSPGGVQNIINRVTGGNLSKIDGEIRQRGGEANLFLLNPKGIVFGPDSKLDVNASFIASTASSVLFEDETSFDVGPQNNSSLFTSSIPVGLQFGEEAGAIHSQARNSQDPVPVGLGVPTGQTLALIGNGVSITGEPVANSDGFQGYAGITALRGRIEFGSVAQGEKVDLEPVSNRLSDGWTVGYESVESFQEISLSAALLASSSFE